MALLIRSVARSSCLLKQTSMMVPKRSNMATTAYEEMSTFWARNRKLNRPLSPFLTVYKPHLAMMTSLTHRVTGVAMQNSSQLDSLSLFIFFFFFQAWDAGYGFSLKTLYKSGYFVMALTAVVTTYFVFGVKCNAL
ncbi:hypothetical protein EGW08_014015 [Elysia chlorotica]|uniref:Uncharacterized protein n=1 Tax=Elysia chlorotica TaxID=188477 RepID=A0A433T9E1_ELYCH|nr:hypothetical protein EGW08_014015 [Elysia chlorotica]